MDTGILQSGLDILLKGRKDWIYSYTVWQFEHLNLKFVNIFEY